MTLMCRTVIDETEVVAGDTALAKMINGPDTCKQAEIRPVMVPPGIGQPVR